ILTEQGLVDGGLRVGVKGGGCAGFSYTMNLDQKPLPEDEIFEVEGIRIFCDPKSFLYLDESEIDFEDDLAHRGFRFKNPNSSGSCGCGASFAV
ncbi:MAG: iron-sulfur cluster assembly accessory protein, partial [Planctomycetota bacterium]